MGGLEEPNKWEQEKATGGGGFKEIVSGQVRKVKLEEMSGRTILTYCTVCTNCICWTAGGQYNTICTILYNILYTPEKKDKCSHRGT